MKETMRKLSPFILRIGISLVLLWFGFTQLKDPSSWTRMIPDFVLSTGLSPTNIIYINGSIEILLAILLLVGLFTRIASLIVALHLLEITLIVGYGPVGARDLALTIAALAIFFYGADDLTVDSYRKKKPEINKQA